ncbi:MAG: phosphohistidine phosphatase SixA [Candidatus Methylomirabilales bacterium]
MSLKLYFLRHGQAGNRQDWHGDDSERPLTAEGKKRLKREAAAIWKLDLPLDVIISSPLVRALQTAEILAKAADPSTRVITDDRLAPGFGPKDLTAILADHNSARGLLLVGHEPDFSETIGHVTGGGRVTMKKGSLAYVDVEDPSSLEGTLVWLIPPKALER